MMSAPVWSFCSVFFIYSEALFLALSQSAALKTFSPLLGLCGLNSVIGGNYGETGGDRVGSRVGGTGVDRDRRLMPVTVCKEVAPLMKGKKKERKKENFFSYLFKAFFSQIG